MSSLLLLRTRIPETGRWGFRQFEAPQGLLTKWEFPERARGSSHTSWRQGERPGGADRDVGLVWAPSPGSGKREVTGSLGKDSEGTQR